VSRLSTVSSGNHYPPGNISGNHFCQWLNRPHGHSAAERIKSMQIPVTSSEIETGVFWLVTQCINKLRHRVLSFALYNSLTSVLFHSTWTENNCYTSYILLCKSRRDDAFNQSKITCFQTHYNTSSFIYPLTLRRLMSYIYGAPILDVSRSHTTTQHSR